ncbi:MAG: phenylalanine--tRNA ligase subunit beta [Clostridia bacterium]|nr:phenylalanine--tRNA ligase subunit beta [Clostridia bacterium]
MKLALSFLSDYVKSEFYKTPQAYCDRMTATGSKVEGYEFAGANVDGVVIGKIVEISRHPDADRLQVCKVDVAGEKLLQVVTAATNVFVGAVVPVALDGASLPGDVKIKTGKLRGEVSEGMFCSIAELELTTFDMPDAIEDGILILPEDAPLGTDIREYLMLSDTIVEFEITPNRPDCLSVIGLARETAASFGVEANIPTPVVKGGAGKTEELVSVTVEDADLCERYCARAVKNVKIAPSPLWLRSRLRLMGVRPINNIVDITNLVMLEYGQPMHAFDHRTLTDGKIIVRRAKAGEKMTTLDGVEHELTEQMLMICDAARPVGVAGVMGGENSEIREDTTTVVFESAIFNGASIRKTSRALGLRTEASGRFEKGLDPETAPLALARACELVELLGCGEVTDDVIDVYPTPRTQTLLPVEVERTCEFLGISITRERYEEILKSLDFVIEDDYITVPFYRQDVVDFADIAEEIARIYGYDKIQASAFKTPATVGGRGEFGEFVRSLASICTSLGAYEIQTYSFIGEKYYDAIGYAADDVRRKSVVITNPLGEDTSLMRTTSVPSMLDVLGHNFNYQNPCVRLFELARLYRPVAGEELPEETRALTLGAYGDVDFYAFKGMVETVLTKVLGEGNLRNRTYEILPATECFLHPGRAAKVVCDGEEIGVFGEVAPKIAQNFGLSTRTYVASLCVEKLFVRRIGVRKFSALPKFPAMTRDLSLVCDKALTVGEIEKIIIQAGGKKLENVRLFDTYEGEQVPAGKKSLSFALTLRGAEKTMTDEEADKIVKKTLSNLEFHLGITLRA